MVTDIKTVRELRKELCTKYVHEHEFIIEQVNTHINYKLSEYTKKFWSLLKIIVLLEHTEVYMEWTSTLSKKNT